MPLTESQLRASEKWEAANCKRLTIKFRTEEFESLEAYCIANGIPKNGFVRQAVAEALHRVSGTADSSRL